MKQIKLQNDQSPKQNELTEQPMPEWPGLICKVTHSYSGHYMSLGE